MTLEGLRGGCVGLYPLNRQTIGRDGLSRSMAISAARTF